MKTKLPARKNTLQLIIFLVVWLVASHARAQLPTANQIAQKMKVGWNLGNTLEAICDETIWGGAITTKELIDSVKAAGFNTVRLPVAWFCHSDTTTNTIDDAWISRVREVVNYCIKDSMYVIINIHWDGGWLENNVTPAAQARVIARQRAYWTQIAKYFKWYNEHLLFAGSNEPNVKDSAGMAVLMTYHQAFIDAVRATGGNNSSRTLIIQGPSTDISLSNQLFTQMPADQIADRLMFEVHYYSPYPFCLMENDAWWGNMFYYWGDGFHSKNDITRNATWGEENDMDQELTTMKRKFVDKGIPVIVGEFATIKRTQLTGDALALHTASREHYYRYFVRSARSKGIIPYCWDINQQMFNRHSAKRVDKGLLNAVMQGADEALTSISSHRNQPFGVYPNPSKTVFRIRGERADEILRIEIFDTLGKKLETTYCSGSAVSSVFGSSLRSGLYLVRIVGEQFSGTVWFVKNE